MSNAQPLKTEQPDPDYGHLDPETAARLETGAQRFRLEREILRADRERPLERWHMLGSELYARGGIELEVALRIARRVTTAEPLPGGFTRDLVAAWFCAVVDDVHRLAGVRGLDAVWMLLDLDQDVGNGADASGHSISERTGAEANPNETFMETVERDGVNYLTPASLTVVLKAAQHYMLTVLARASEYDIKMIVALVQEDRDTIDGFNPLETAISNSGLVDYAARISDARAAIARCIGRDRPKHNEEIADAVGSLASDGHDMAAQYRRSSVDRIGIVVWMAHRAFVKPPEPPKSEPVCLGREPRKALDRRKERARRAANKRRAKTSARKRGAR